MKTERVEIDMTRIMQGAAGLVLVAAASLAVFASCGTLEAPAEMPVPPAGSSANYSTPE